MITNLDQRQCDIWLKQIKMWVVNNYDDLLELTIEEIYQQGRMDFIKEYKEKQTNNGKSINGITTRNCTNS